MQFPGIVVLFREFATDFQKSCFLLQRDRDKEKDLKIHFSVFLQHINVHSLKLQKAVSKREGLIKVTENFK